jgi:hypothetical protein
MWRILSHRSRRLEISNVLTTGAMVTSFRELLADGVSRRVLTTMGHNKGRQMIIVGLQWFDYLIIEPEDPSDRGGLTRSWPVTG